MKNTRILITLFVCAIFSILIVVGLNYFDDNALFAVKRKTIIERDKGAVFIPVCTKNVFLKMYSNEVGLKNMQRWDTVDAECYLDEIKRVLIKEARVCQTEVK